MDTNQSDHGGGFDRAVREISIRGRLAIGLHYFATACQSRGLIEHREIRLFLDQMWQFVALQGTGFAIWEKANPLLIHVGLGDDFPPGFIAFLRSKGVDKTEFRELLANLVEVVYNGAYGASNNQKTLDFLMAVVDAHANGVVNALSSRGLQNPIGPTVAAGATIFQQRSLMNGVIPRNQNNSLRSTTMNRILAYSTFPIILALATSLPFPSEARAQPKEPDSDPALLKELKTYQHKIVYESNRDGNFELYLCNADGSNPINLTNTKDVDEVYPKPSPDGTKICFCADEGKGAAKIRNIYYMNSDGTGRTKIASNGREPCWSPDGTKIAYMKGEFEKFTYSDAATKGLFIYDLKSKETRQHVNDKLLHLYTLNWSPDGKWFVATVHGGMGFRHNILAIEANGDKFYDLKLSGCRPNISPDGKKVCWGHGDYCAGVAELDFAGPEPKAVNIIDVVESKDPVETYHVTWSPDMKYLTFTKGPRFKGKSLKGLLPEFPGVEAPGWNICVADAKKRNRWVALTTDGKSNKQPCWVVVAVATPRVDGRKE